MYIHYIHILFPIVTIFTITYAYNIHICRLSPCPSVPFLSQPVIYRFASPCDADAGGSANAMIEAILIGICWE